jgi:hypothetical protein
MLRFCNGSPTLEGMKLGVITFATIGLLGLSSVALAQTPPPRVGFQMDIRTGYSLPLGKLANGTPDLSDSISGQVPFIVDIGGKIIPELFIGGYFGMGFGGAAGAGKTQCEASGSSCSTLGLSFGVEAQYHILPGGMANPWIGYGLGYESLTMTQSAGGTSVSATLSGFQFARLMGGVDFRINRVFGVGPFVDLSMGKYSSISNDNTSADIPETAMHEWLTLGARFVFFP